MSDLYQRLKTGGQLPTPPGVVLRLLSLTRSSDVSARKIADTISLDPGLSAKVLRFVNSPMAGGVHYISSLRQAVALIGLRAVQMLALSFSLLAAVAPKRCKGFEHEQFALQSIACAAAARLLTQGTQMNSVQDAFMAGLLSQLGRLVFATSLPDEYAEVLRSAEHVPADLPPLERDAFGAAYPQVGAWLLRGWNIPDTLCTAVDRFRDVDHEDQALPLARILHVGELAASFVCSSTTRQQRDIRPLTQAAQKYLSLEPEHCKILLMDIAKDVHEMQEVLELSKGSALTPEEIEAEVNERLAELNVATHLEIQALSVRQEDLLHRATTDPLTGIGNRTAFEARMSLELERCARTHAPFTLLMVDIDRFKTINDTHGHQAGDRVMQEVARTLKGNLRTVDFAARYGGDEFAIIAPETDEDGSRHLSERIRTCIEKLYVSWEGEPLQVTISVGAAVFTEIVDGQEASTIIRAADAQLYAAKCAKRNCVSIFVQEPSEKATRASGRASRDNGAARKRAATR